MRQSVMGRNDNKLCPICYLDTDIKVESETRKKADTIQLQKEQQQQEQNIQIQCRNYVKKLQRLKMRLKQRDKIHQLTKQNRNVVLSLSPGNKSSLPKSKPMDMHIPVANWQLQFENNRHKACVIEID